MQTIYAVLIAIPAALVLWLGYYLVRSAQAYEIERKAYYRGRGYKAARLSKPANHVGFDTSQKPGSKHPRIGL